MWSRMVEIQFVGMGDVVMMIDVVSISPTMIPQPRKTVREMHGAQIGKQVTDDADRYALFYARDSNQPTSKL